MRGVRREREKKRGGGGGEGKWKRGWGRREVIHLHTPSRGWERRFEKVENREGTKRRMMMRKCKERVSRQVILLL